VGVQALVRGLAVVASRVGGFLDLVDEGRNGYLFPSDDEDSMVDVLRSFLTDHAKLLEARRHSLRVVTRFDIVAIADAYEKILGKVARS
jgi:glycosyltransferase involved in cell wall biosynthesis